jgi:membrane dipeptidase
MTLDWPDLPLLADTLDSQRIEVEGWIAPFEVEARHSYFLLVPDMACCIGCRPSDPHNCIEVFAAQPIAPQGTRVRLAGRFHRLIDDPAGWQYQLREAVLLGPARPKRGVAEVSRRAFVAMGAALPIGSLTRPSLPWRSVAAGMGEDDARQMLAGLATIDLHSHSGGILRFTPNTAFTEVAADMKSGAMAAICLAVVADSPATKILSDGRIQAFREPDPGELYSWSRRTFPRVNALIRNQGLRRIERAADLLPTQSAAPGVIVSAEGADFLDRSLERLQEAHASYGLRHLQLTHYRVNELGDIQTEAPVHGGLTDFGADVIRACNQLGIVVDVAHGTFDLVKRAAEVTSKPLVLSHTSLAAKPGPRSRQITADHARLIAATKGVIGVWPVYEIFKDMTGYATGFARMVDVVGIDHVGLGSDMRGLTGLSLFNDYASLPRLAAALSTRGFSGEEIAKLLGGNYRRVFAQTVG